MRAGRGAHERNEFGLSDDLTVNVIVVAVARTQNLAEHLLPSVIDSREEVQWISTTNWVTRLEKEPLGTSSSLVTGQQESWYVCFDTFFMERTKLFCCNRKNERAGRHKRQD